MTVEQLYEEKKLLENRINKIVLEFVKTFPLVNVSINVVDHPSSKYPNKKYFHVEVKLM